MHSVATPDSDDAALDAAIARYDGDSPTTAQIRQHFSSGAGASPGGRIRMRLVLAAAADEGAPPVDALEAACAVEILHNYSLVHEHVERGPFGTAHGINAGDALCAIAYLQLLSSPLERPAQRTLAMTSALHEANLAMCAGQARSVAFEARPLIGLAEYLEMIEGRTAALYGAACELGARAASAHDERAAAYANLGRTLGLAHQIDEDAADAWSDLRRRWTYPVVWALAGPPSPLRDRLAALFADRQSNDGDGQGLLEELGALEATHAAARELRVEAERIAVADDVDRAGKIRTIFDAANRALR